jgi:CheY-like chemotaxis protein
MSHKILVVDDERRIADTLALILKHGGYVTAAAYDGASALQLSTEFQPDLVITDAVMPGMSGIELAMACFENIPRCKILLFSGQAATAEMLRACKLRYDLPLLSKPVHPEDLLKKVAEILNSSGWRSGRHCALGSASTSPVG